MVIALLSDLHANHGALTACLKHAERAGAERYVFLGDIVGYGADTALVVATVERYVAAGAIAVKGNHDAAVERTDHSMIESARAAIDFARGSLDAAARGFLADLPLVVREGALTCVHASAAHPDRWTYVEDPGAAARSMIAAATPYTFSGHVHDQWLYFRATEARVGSFRPVPGSPVRLGPHRQWLALVGSVGQPRDGDPAAAYALFDSVRTELVFHRVPYDHREAARRVRAAGLPEILARRLEEAF
jgi:predicted phosphodiesterase